MPRSISIPALFGTALAGLAAGTAGAQPREAGPPRGAFPPGTIIQRQTNTTGSGADYVIAPGATGADTITTNSAAGGNAGQPERAIPQGSGGGGSGGGSSR